jgi:hypothetical protein
MSRLVLDPAVLDQAATDGLSEFSHIEVVFHFRRETRVRPWRPRSALVAPSRGRAALAYRFAQISRTVPSGRPGQRRSLRSRRSCDRLAPTLDPPLTQRPLTGICAATAGCQSRGWQEPVMFPDPDYTRPLGATGQ